MSDRIHIADADLKLYAMGALSAEEMAQARAHLRGCARCAEELRQNTLALAAYAQTTPEVAPPAGARERFMARLTETAAGTAAGTAAEPAAVPVRLGKIEEAKSKTSGFWPGGGSWALAGALAVLLVVVAVDDFRKRAEIGPLLAEAQRGQIDSAQLNQLMELLTSSQAQKVSLHQTPVASPPPEGRVVYAAHSGKLLLTASNLKPLPAGKTYELWILQPGGGKPLPAGTFSPDSSGNAAMILANEPANLAVAGFGVTIEKEGGSDVPTPPIVLSGQ
jgi:anti-sigma-K factor RskA